jgi:hypothetical protein
MLTEKYNNQSKEIVSYDYTDFADGTGVQIFYLANTKNSSAEDQILTASSSVRPYKIEQYASTTTYTGWTLALAQDYDLSAFNKPQTIGGTCLVTGSAILDCQTGTGGATSSAYMVIEIKKVSGSTITTIASGTSETWVDNGGSVGTFQNKNYCIPISLSNTNFKIGDILRVSMNIYMLNNSGVYTGAFYFGTDPLARDGTSMLAANGVTTQTKVHMPFRIDA